METSQRLGGMVSQDDSPDTCRIRIEIDGSAALVLVLLFVLERYFGRSRILMMIIVLALLLLVPTAFIVLLLKLLEAL